MDNNQEYTKSGWRIPSRWKAFWIGVLIGMFFSVVILSLGSI